MRVGPLRKLSAKEQMLPNYGAGEDSWESLGLQKRSNQSILKEMSPEYSSEGLMLKVKLQYFGHLIWRAYSLEKILMLGKTEGKRKRQRQRMTWLDGSWLNRHESEQMAHDSINMNLSKLWEIVGDKGAWCEVVLGLWRVGHDIVTKQQQNTLSILHLCVKS